jgi:hypothetical protein
MSHVLFPIPKSKICLGKFAGTQTLRVRQFDEEKLRAGVLFEKPRSARLPPVEQTSGTETDTVN